MGVFKRISREAQAAVLAGSLALGMGRNAEAGMASDGKAHAANEAAKSTKELPKRAFAWIDEPREMPLIFHPKGSGVEFPEAKREDLVRLEGRDPEGNPREILLDKDAATAWQRVCDDFNANAPAELKAEGCYLVWGYRGEKEQELVHDQVKGSAAGSSKLSIHSTGMAIDIYKGNRQPMYYWFNGTPEEQATPGFVSRLKRNGFVLNEPTEPWHAVYAGKNGEEQDLDGIYEGHPGALAFGQAYDTKINDPKNGHPHFLRVHMDKPAAKQKEHTAAVAAAFLKSAAEPALDPGFVHVDDPGLIDDESAPVEGRDHSGRVAKLDLE